MGLFSNNKKIKFDGKKYIVKLPCLGATFLWEEEFDKFISDMSTTKEQIFFAYALLKAGNSNFNYEFDDFIKYIEKDSKPVNEISEYLLKKNEDQQKKLMEMLKMVKK